jgi:hypothetical protein
LSAKPAQNNHADSDETGDDGEIPDELKFCDGDNCLVPARGAK